jgi:hypothetical protein
MKVTRVSIDADTYYDVRTLLSVAVGALRQERQIYSYKPEEILALYDSMLTNADFIFPADSSAE